jgi:hypothetical protein
MIDQMVQSIVTNTPELLDNPDLELWISKADFSTYILALRNTDWFAFNVFDKVEDIWEIQYPGATPIKIVAINGLKPTNNKHYFIASYASNWRFGYDTYSANDYEFWYNKEYRTFFYRWGGKYGINNAFDKYVHLGVSN